MRYLNLFWKPLVLMLVLGCLFGCGGDDLEDNGSIADPAPDDDNQIPTITIEKLRSEKVIGRWAIGEKVWWRLNASSSPKTDLAVMGSFGGSRWVIIPKSKNSSEEFSNTSNDEIQIHPLPMVSIVGKGLVVDLEKLQEELPDESLGGHRIPEDFDFPLYKVGEPSKIVWEVEVIERVGAEFKSSIPPDGGVLSANASLVLIFSAAPENVTVNGKPATVAGKTATLAGPHTPGRTAFAIAWDNGPGGEAGSATVNLNVIAPDTTAPTIARKNFPSKDADPAPLNRNGVIIEFSEPIARHSLKLTLEDGTDLGWLPKIDGTKITFEAVRGKELENETTYIVQGEVLDAVGNRTSVRETFVTRLK